MAKESPLERAKNAMSGRTTASRIAAAENSPKPGVKPQPGAKAEKAYVPPPKYVSEREALIEAARKEDEAKLKAKGMKKGGRVRGSGCCKKGVRKAKMY